MFKFEKIVINSLRIIFSLLFVNFIFMNKVFGIDLNQLTITGPQPPTETEIARQAFARLLQVLLPILIIVAISIIILIVAIVKGRKKSREEKKENK